MHIKKELTKRLKEIKTKIENIFPIKNQNILKSKIIELSQGFTENKELIGEKYFEQNDFLIAYLHYFLFVSYSQGFYLLKYLENNQKNLKKDMALDIGCGQGAFSLVLSDFGIKKIYGIDYSEKALKIASKIVPNFFPINGNFSEKIKLETKFDFIVFGHSLNEYIKIVENDKIKVVDLLNHYSQFLEDHGYIIIVEPADSKINRILLEMHNLLIENGYYFLFPCTGNYKCPVLEINGKCHSEYQWEKPDFIEKLIDNKKIKKEILNFTGFILKKSHQKEKNSNTNFRVISDRMLNKGGKYRYFLCNSSGRWTVTMKKTQESKCLDSFMKLKRGDLVNFERYSLSTNNQNTIELNKDSIIKIIETII